MVCLGCVDVVPLGLGDCVFEDDTTLFGTLTLIGDKVGSEAGGGRSDRKVDACVLLGC